MNELNWYNLPLSAATECFEFTEHIIRGMGSDDDAMIPESKMDMFHEFKKDLLTFRDFMSIAVNSKFEVVTIPQRHHAIYDCLGKVGAISVLLDTLPDNHKKEVMAQLMERIRKDM